MEPSEPKRHGSLTLDASDDARIKKAHDVGVKVGKAAAAYLFSRAHYHQMLDEAMDSTTPGDSFVGNFVNRVIKERGERYTLPASESETAAKPAEDA